MPFEAEHSCRLNAPGSYVRFRRENGEQEHDGKPIDVIYGIKKDEGAEIQSLRYPKDKWDEEAAKAHCSSREGTFEPAAEEESTDLADLETQEIEGIEIMAVGTWNGSPKPRTYSKADLTAMVTAFDELKGNSNYEPPVKLGHDDKQTMLQKDGMPAAGWVSKLKVTGDKLVADFKQVPGKIADIIKAGGWKKVSSEIMFDYKVGEKTYPAVLRAVSLLGGDIPAVKTIADIVATYDEDAQVTVTIYELAEDPEPVTLDEIMADIKTLKAKMEGNIKGKLGSPAIRTYLKEVMTKLRSLASKHSDELEESLDQASRDVRDAFYDQSRAEIPLPMASGDDIGYIAEVYPAYIVLERHKGMEYAKIPYTRTSDGVTFDFAQAVEVEQIFQEVRKSKEVDNMETKELIKVFKLAEDATEEAVLEAARLAMAPKPEDKDTDKVQALTDKLAERDRDDEVKKAIASGKLLPAQKEWADKYALADPEGFSAWAASAPKLIDFKVHGSEEDTVIQTLTDDEETIRQQMGETTKEELITSKGGTA